MMCLKEGGDELTLLEVAQLVGYSKIKTAEMLRVLRDLGYIETTNYRYGDSKKPSYHYSLSEKGKKLARHDLPQVR